MNQAKVDCLHRTDFGETFVNSRKKEFREGFWSEKVVRETFLESAC